MKYQNRQPPEGINVSRVSPLRQFFKLAIGAMVLILLLVVIVQFAGAGLAKQLPFKYELLLTDTMELDLGTSAGDSDMETYLNDLATSLMAHMPVPEGVAVTVHYSNEDTFNAFATLGGNLVFFKGLLEKLPNENALAMVMAHEIAHVIHRDPIAGLGGGVASSVAVMLLTGQNGTGAAGRWLSSTGAIGNVQFTRAMEREADRAALGALVANYGHASGAQALFELFKDARGPSDVPDWLERFASTHPLDSDRIAFIERLSLENEWPVSGPVTALPVSFTDWL